MESIFAYNEKVGPYRFISFLYEKVYGGIIAADSFYYPLDEFNKHISDMLKKNDINKKQNEQYINKYIKKNHLNEKICEKLKNDSYLRFLICIGFHDCKIYNIIINNNILNLALNELDAWNFNGSERDKVTLSFYNFYAEQNISEIKDLHIDDFRVNFDNDKISFYLLCHNRETPLIEKEIIIYCDNATVQ